MESQIANINIIEQANCARKYKLSAQFGTSMSAWLIHMNAGIMKGSTVRRLISHTSWVKYVVRQYGFYLLEEIRIK
jgi:hypothetical protein